LSAIRLELGVLYQTVELSNLLNEILMRFVLSEYMPLFDIMESVEEIVIFGTIEITLNIPQIQSLCLASRSSTNRNFLYVLRDLLDIRLYFVLRAPGRCVNASPMYFMVKAIAVRFFDLLMLD
jgi:hypothetical protein